MKDPILVAELMELVRYQPQDVIAYLDRHPDLATGRLDTEENPRYGGNHLIHYASEYWQRPILRHLLAHGVDPNTRGADSQTPLHCATATHNLEGVRALLAAGADPNARDDGGLPPIDRCLENHAEHAEVFQALLDGGAEPRLVPALAQGRTDVVAALVRELSFDQLRAQAGNESIFEYADWHDNREELVALLRQAGFEE